MNLNNNSHEMLDKDAKKYALEERQHLQQMVTGKLDVHMWKNENRFVSIISNKNKLQVDQISQCSIWNAEISGRKHRQYPTKYGFRKEHFNKTLFTHDSRPPIDKWNLIKLKGFCTAIKEKSISERRSQKTGKESWAAVQLIEDWYLEYTKKQKNK